jgi:ABC-type sugar transport system permease subunit
MRIWDTGFPQDKMGMAAAMSFVFALLLMVFSVISFRFFSSERA